MKYCAACSMPLTKPEDFAQGDESSDFCLYCVNQDGTVRTCEEIFEGGVNFFLKTLGDDRAMAEKICRKNMQNLPYWQGKDCACLQGEAATDEEFSAAMQKLG
jgi:hypothetical protein